VKSAVILSSRIILSRQYDSEFGPTLTLEKTKNSLAKIKKQKNCLRNVSFPEVFSYSFFSSIYFFAHIVSAF